ncbi:unnamed protein product, partial [Meganyctiphanes norvegica]
QMSRYERLAEASKSPYQEQPSKYVQFIFWVVPLINIATGSTYLAFDMQGFWGYHCQADSDLSILMIVWGVIALLSALFLAARVESTTLRLVHIISPIVLIVACVKLYLVFEPNYDDTSHYNYCPFVFYWIAFCSMTLALCFYVVFAICVCRFTPCMYSCCNCESCGRQSSDYSVDSKNLS